MSGEWIAAVSGQGEMIMAANTGNTAAKLPELDADQEPSMDDILASIRQIIADDEDQPDDGLTERERYTHPTDHSNANVEDTKIEEAGIEAAMAAEMEAIIAEEAPLTIEQKAAQLRAQIAAAGEGLTTEERLEKYRMRGKPDLPITPQVATPEAVLKAQETPMAPEFIAEAAAASVALPSTAAVAEQIAVKMMDDKSSEIENILGEMMRPIVRTWLSTNLPTLVERLVQEEIQAVSRGKKAS